MPTTTAMPPNRVSVSLRLPAGIAAAVSAYAEQHALRKTDAYLHFLELGLNQAREADEARTLDRMAAQLDEIASLLKSGNAAATQHKTKPIDQPESPQQGTHRCDNAGRPPLLQ